MSYQQEIADILAGALASMGIDSGIPDDLTGLVEVPKNKENGDFAVPCFFLSRVLRKSPKDIAAELLPPVSDQLARFPNFSSVTALGPYLNFRVDNETLAAALIPSILDGTFLARRSANKIRVMIEYSQPNTHKAFHVGHTRNVALGDALWRIFDWSGYEVVPVNYIGDEGAHIAKCLWYFRNYHTGPVPDVNLGEFLGDLYRQATIMLDFSTLTRCPIPGITAAKVLSISDFPGNKKLKTAEIDTGTDHRTVICGGTGYKVGDIVAYAHPGARVAGRLIGSIEKKGVRSTGMICSEAELSLSDRKMPIYVFPEGTALGLEAVEFFRVDGALPDHVSVIEEMAKRKEGVADTLKKLEARDPELTHQWEETREWSMDEFREIYRWLNVRFDHYFYESEVGEAGRNIVRDYYEKGVFVKSEGAIGIDLTEDGLPFFLLLKSDGSGLYATKDLALARDKFENFNIDRSIYVVDASQSLHFQQVFKTLEKMGYERAKNCYHLAYGLVVLPDGKMGSRFGNIILFSELKSSLEQKIELEFLNKYRGEWPEEEIEEAVRRISVATIKYGMNNQDNLKNIVFNMEDWTDKSGNTGPYLLYAYARTRSILREAGEWDADLADWSLLTHETEKTLITRISKFHEVADRACREYRPQWLCIYLFQLAKDFSRMYDNCPVLKAETESLKITRLLLTDAAGRLIRQSLALLGIVTLERM